MTCGFMEEIAAAAIFFSPKKNRIRILQKGQHEKYNGIFIKIQNKTENSYDTKFFKTLYKTVLTFL